VAVVTSPRAIIIFQLTSIFFVPVRNGIKDVLIRQSMPKERGLHGKSLALIFRNTFEFCPNETLVVG